MKNKKSSFLSDNNNLLINKINEHNLNNFNDEEKYVIKKN